MEALYENSATIPTALRRRRNGHIDLLTDAAVYANVATTAFAWPTDPAPYAQHRPGNSAAAQPEENEIQKNSRIIYDLDNNVDAALKQKIISVGEET